MTKVNQRRERAAARRRQDRVKQILIVAGGILLLAAVVYVLSSGSSTDTGGGFAQAGQKLADFSLVDLDGNTVRLSDYAGRPVLINAWATWCPPCRAEMPDLHAFYQAHQDEGFVLLAVNAGEEAAPVDDFIQQMGFTFPVLLDPNTQVLGRMGINSFPTSVFVDGDGVVRKVHIGLYSAEALEAELTPLLAAR